MVNQKHKLARLLRLIDLRGLFLHIRLMLGRKALAVIIIDLLLVVNVAILGLMASDRVVSFLPVSLPFLLLGIPLLADIVAMERRAGSLDLVLAIPSSHGYFQRRVLALAILMLLQGVTVLIFDRVFLGTFSLVPAILFIVVQLLFISTAVLFFASIMKSPGAVTLAVFGVILLVSPWFFTVPLYAGQMEDGSNAGYGELSFWMSPYAVLAWLKPVAVLLLASVIMYSYARRRYRLPELLLLP